MLLGKGFLYCDVKSILEHKKASKIGFDPVNFLRFSRLFIQGKKFNPRRTLKLKTITTYRSSKYRDISVIIIDSASYFSREDHRELGRYLVEDLLSTQEDLALLAAIKIEENPRSVEGSWTAQIQPQNIRFGSFQKIFATIKLNYKYLKTLDLLKEILAHEYGHHWTLTHCLRKYWCYSGKTLGEIFKESPMPEDYYQKRKLNASYFRPDALISWSLCDKEVIAEDYRVLFAPAPYNQEHQIVAQLKDKIYSIDDPEDDVRLWIEDLDIS